VHPNLIAQGFSLARNRYVLGLIGLGSLIAVCGLCLIFWIYLIFYLLGKGCGQSRETVEMFRLPEG